MTKIQVETIINKDIKTVWENWTKPESIKEWCFASPDWGVGNVENDVKVGGRFLTNMKALDGSFAFDFTGEYTEVEEYKKLKYKMDKGENEEVNRECEVLFEEMEVVKEGGGEAAAQTKVIEIFDAENVNDVEMQKAGWQSILDNFKKYVEKI
jgi:uncharacterized protein YndB with AHSA1/START domain